MSFKAQTHFNTICNFRVISPHWLLPPRRLACLRARTALQMRLRHLPPISVLTTTYAFTPHLPYHPYACVGPSRHASDTAYLSYVCGVPSRHPPNTAYHPYACGVLSQHAPDTASHPYTCGVPSQHHLSLCCGNSFWCGMK
ncbi:hypothetical protein O181_078192 [Austropuccinia psidii MF-1]|uniref:Uncharacterized protein n=1 Tax=Austropuccinia psidii MF-1 TaxID=1389203 RepID=A0A9Q3FHC4_9BASI|nr:hypothetical protein [Austropuccinia psidii MF-1]